MNLIITCARHMEEETADEITGILERLGDDSPDITITDMSGILTVTTTLDPVTVSNTMKEMLADEPWTIRYCMRAIPIHETLKADTDAIIDTATGRAHTAIPKDATYRITIEKRNTGISGSKIIGQVAQNIKNKVSLDHPDIIILVEILGGIAGIAILRDTDIFSAEKTRRNMNI